MKRRAFITLLGGAAAAWPLAARAQQRERMRRIGVLMGGADSDPIDQARLAAFLDGLQQLGWTDGRNVRIDYRWYAGNTDAARKYAAELVGLAPDVILGSASASVAALQQASRSAPIVFANVVGPDDHKARPKPVIDGEAPVVPPPPKSQCPSWLGPVPKAEKRVDDGPTVSNTRLPKSDAAGPRRRGRSGWSLSTPTANSPRFISAKAASCAEPTCLRRPSRPCCGAIERS